MIGSLCNLTDSQFNLLANELQDQLSVRNTNLLVVVVVIVVVVVVESL